MPNLKRSLPAAESLPCPASICQRIRVTGVVQGVGFRPSSGAPAKGADLVGWCATARRRRDRGAVLRPRQRADRASRQDAPRWPASTTCLHGPAKKSAEVAGDFLILESSRPCSNDDRSRYGGLPDCLAEMFDRKSRRWRYAFSNCTHCGPRYTISRGCLRPARTALAPPRCRDCREEYEQPANRRFHAEANCCPKCGPSLMLVDESAVRRSGDPIAETLGLRGGGIVAMKGLGGFTSSAMRRTQKRWLPFANARHARETVRGDGRQRGLGFGAGAGGHRRARAA